MSRGKNQSNYSLDVLQESQEIHSDMRPCPDSVLHIDLDLEIITNPLGGFVVSLGQTKFLFFRGKECEPFRVQIPLRYRNLL